MGLWDSLSIEKSCWKCGKRVWFWQDKGKHFEATPDTVFLSHKGCKK